ncbi:zinc-ribbon domain-containing protein, partial [Streptomyces sp. NPDC001793]|uniref:zinc-ribbon domain-containing protein n=1 Tax=Streptomyces sp. NPDC001793 TaxID=3154657 RepID=UPI00332D4218
MGVTGPSRCRNCGEPLAAGDNYCGRCGAPAPLHHRHQGRRETGRHPDGTSTEGGRQHRR